MPEKKFSGIFVIIYFMWCNHPKLAVFLFKNQTPTFV